MKACEGCGGPLALELVAEYREVKIGIDGVVLNDAVWAERCPEGHYGEVTVPNLPGLVAAVAVARIKLAVKLGGQEVRFLRRALGLTGKELAERLEVAPETVSRWENNRDPIKPPYERLLRLQVGNHLASQAPLIPYDPRHVDTMHIASVRSVGHQLIMHFRAVPADEEANEPQKKVWVKAA